MTLPSQPAPCDFAFGRYRVLKDKRSLLDGDTPVRIGSRAFDLLTTLIERAGEVDVEVARRDACWRGRRRP